jgi:integrase
MARIRLKHVNAFRNKNRNDGKVRYYFRRPGQKAIPLPGPVGSDEFMSAYGLALAILPDPPREVGADRTMPGTVDALAVSYYKSAEWQALAQDTQRTRRYSIEAFRARHGMKRVSLLRSEHIRLMLAEIDRPSGKVNWLKTIRGLLQFAIPTLLQSDPTAGITVKRANTGGHHSWTDQEIAQYRAHWPLGTQQRLVLEFALETASRRGEIVRLGPQHVRNGRIRIERSKGSRDVDIPLTAELTAAIAAMPKAHLTFITTLDGRPRAKSSLSAEFRAWVAEAGLPAHCHLHGLKKSALRRLAEDGATAHELMAISGHKTLSEVQRYADAADKVRLADSAMAKRGFK